MAPTDPTAPERLQVLVTRPAYQQAQLVGLVEQLDGQAYRFPTLEIVPLENQQPLVDKLKHLDQFDIAVFVSPNAADHVFGILNSNQLSLPPTLKLACVGKGCSNTVADQGYKVDAAPTEGIGSEGLLKHPLLQSVGDKRVIIFRGNGGRELLAETLRRRGAAVEYCECYRRRAPEADAKPLLDHWQTTGIDIVTITSTQALENLWSMLGPGGEPLLKSTPVVVISERIAESARKLGCQTVLVTDDTSDRSIIDCIKQWRSKQIAI